MAPRSKTAKFFSILKKYWWVFPAIIAVGLVANLFGILPFSYVFGGQWDAATSTCACTGLGQASLPPGGSDRTGSTYDFTTLAYANKESFCGWTCSGYPVYDSLRTSLESLSGISNLDLAKYIKTPLTFSWSCTDGHTWTKFDNTGKLWESYDCFVYYSPYSGCKATGGIDACGANRNTEPCICKAVTVQPPPTPIPPVMPTPGPGIVPTQPPVIIPTQAPPATCSVDSQCTTPCSFCDKSVNQCRYIAGGCQPTKDNSDLIIGGIIGLFVIVLLLFAFMTWRRG